jgi:hypothetical protein
MTTRLCAYTPLGRFPTIQTRRRAAGRGYKGFTSGYKAVWGLFGSSKPLGGRG